MKEIFSLNFIHGGAPEQKGSTSTSTEQNSYDELVQALYEQLIHFKNPDGSSLIEKIKDSPDFQQVLDNPQGMSFLLDTLNRMKPR